MKDNADPVWVGNTYRTLRESGFSVGDAAEMAVRSSRDIDSAHEGPVEKYGRPGDLILVKDAQAPVFARRKDVHGTADQSEPEGR